MSLSVEDQISIIMDISIQSIATFAETIWACKDKTGQLPPWFKHASGVTVEGLSRPSEDEIYRVMKYLTTEMFLAGLNPNTVDEHGVYDARSSNGKRLFVQSFADVIVNSWSSFCDFHENVDKPFEYCGADIKKIASPTYSRMSEEPNPSLIRLGDDCDEEWCKEAYDMPDFVRVTLYEQSISEPKPEETKAEDPKPEETKAEEPKPEETKAEERLRHQRPQRHFKPTEYHSNVKREFKWRDGRWWKIGRDGLFEMSYRETGGTGRWWMKSSKGWIQYKSSTRVFPPRPGDRCTWMWYCE